VKLPEFLGLGRGSLGVTASAGALIITSMRRPTQHAFNPRSMS